MKQKEYFTYRRVNHFNEFIAQYNAQTEVRIPSEVYQTIQKELADSGVDLTYHQVKNILKKHADRQFNHYYDQIPLIVWTIRGEDSAFPQINQEQENNLRYLFMKFEEAYQEWLPPDRRSFTSYKFVFQKLCQKLGYNQFLIFPKIKNERLEKLWNEVWEIVENKIPELQAQKVISRWWRMVLAQRRLNRLRIGKELIYLPGVGIKYKEAQASFERNRFDKV